MKWKGVQRRKEVFFVSIKGRKEEYRCGHQGKIDWKR